MAKAWGMPDNVGVAYIYLRSGESDRSWIGADYAPLDQAAREWLTVARETLQQGAFVRSPNPDDCKYCPHKPVCAPEMHRAEAVLATPSPRRLARLKLEEAMSKPVDSAEREKATHEREHNVIVDAGAGTGKTTLLVARLRLIARTMAAFHSTASPRSRHAQSSRRARWGYERSCYRS
jgi:hypothetical protein